MRIRWQVAVVGMLALTGCRHKQAAVYLPVPPAVTVPLERAPEPPLVAEVPVEPGPPVRERPLPPKKVKKPRKKAVAVMPPAPVEVASSGAPPAANVIGALTAGGEASPAKLQEASDLLASLDRKIAGLPGDWKQKQKDGLVRVRYFEDQARVAVKGGDGEGAVTLATKARVLLEDLTK